MFRVATRCDIVVTIGMRMHKKNCPLTTVRDTLELAGLVVLLTPSLAFAYVDPGYGMLIWQTLVAGALGLGYKIYRMVGRMRHSERKQSEDQQRTAE